MHSITDHVLHTSTDLGGDNRANSREISKEKLSLDVSAIESASKMNQHNLNTSNRSRHENDIAIKEMSHFGGSLASQSLYSSAP